MSDLISRSDVVQILKECNLDETLFEKDVFDKIRNLPTAYSVDNVVEELETERKTANNTYNSFNIDVDLGRVFGLEKAIEIVKQGGVSDSVCEWKQTSTAKYKTGCGYKVEEYFDTKACYCKQCGKKIKVVE